VKPNARTWNTVINSFAKAGKIERAERLVDEFTKAFKLGKMDEKPNLRSWNTLLAACMEKGDIQRAKGFLRRMKEHGIHPDIVSFNTVLSCCARSSQKPYYLVKEIDILVREIHQDSSLTPNGITYLALINAWIGAGRPEKAEAVLKDMCSNHGVKDSIPLERDLFHRVLQAWSAQKSPRRAESLFLAMAELHDRHGFDLKPKVQTYNRLLNAWAKSYETESGERADLILRQMQEISVSGDKDVSPDLISYNSVLNAWANSGDPTAVTRAEHLVLEMILKGNPNLTPTEISYATWLKAIANSNEDDKGRRANGVLETMEIHKLEPTEKILKMVANLANPKDTK
jgi:pentatricopeptide repeat protein